MKNIKKFYLLFMFFLILIFIFNMNICHADTYKGKIIDSGVSLRKGPGTNYERIKTLVEDSVYTLVNNTLVKDEGGCSNGWYQIYYESSSIGYVCSEFVEVSEEKIDVEAKNACEQQLKDLGFDELSLK